MQISDIFYHHKNMDMMNYIIWKYFLQKNLKKSCHFSMILDENPQFSPPKFVKNLHIQNFN